ncbi:hypothetical protein NIES23_45090 [Trichormus variabilis NIES-23]|uniref:Uncharacterized protein n=2 Tax=Nostocaceae TaxID=1162 RepID=A0A1Z4KRR6_ANAVA|nr:all0714 [Nostoc sp. PCC 7120 = FACHB-418]BAY71689.1 hypothetical protein NIES23_45090 [Trichormus variabilis NIES-23]
MSLMQNFTKHPMKWLKLSIVALSSSILVWLSGNWGNLVLALPPVKDIPEEILRTEIIIDARSPIDGQPLTAAEYAQLQAQLQISPPPKLSTNIRQTIFLTRMRKFLLQFFPFLNL